MATSNALDRPVIEKDGRIRIRSAVAYVNMKGYVLPKGLDEALMLTVYVACYMYQNWSKKLDPDRTWLKAERMFIPRSTPQEEQMALIETMQFKVGARFNREYNVVLEATPKKPKEI